MTDYYQVLGVSKDANKEDIKRAYKRLAKKYHPDLNPDNKEAEKKFKEINEAVSILADDQKRQRYDQFGTAEPGAGFDFSDFMKGFSGGFGGFDDIFENFFGGRRRRQSRGEDLLYEIEISLPQASAGTTEQIHLNKLEQCNTCHGTGGSRVTCSNCNGRGMQTQATRTPFGIFQAQTTCRACKGQGTVIDSVCKTCHGDSIRRVRKILQVDIPKGIQDGMRVRLSGQGEAVPNGTPGDLYVEVHVKPHPVFRRKGDDIFLTIPISFTQASLGDSITIPTLEGDATLKIPEGTQGNTTFRMKSKGVHRLRGHGRGDQFVKVFINVPEKLSRKQKVLMKEFSKLEKDSPTERFFKKFFR